LVTIPRLSLRQIVTKGARSPRRRTRRTLAGVSGGPRYRPYEPGPFRWRLGLRPLEVADWIEIDERYDDDVAYKARLADEHPTTVFRAMPGTEPEGAEVLEALVDHLRVTWPERFADIAPPAGLHPLEAAGRLVQEDLVLLVERDGGLVFGAGSVSFPNRWDLPSKVGRSMREVHEPVARLNHQLAEPIDRFFDRLTPDRSFWRLGWGVLDTGELYQPLDGTAPPRPASATFADLHLRVERETLRRFPRTGCVLFTIRTHLTRLADVTADPADAARLAEALERLPDDVADYKQLLDLRALAVAGLQDAARS
jgi:hypothetical protein